MVKSDVSSSLKDFYDSDGWNVENGVTTDAELWEDLRPVASDYVCRCRMRVADYLPRSGSRLLDAASGPVQYSEYLSYSQGFDKRFCIDISQKALDLARAKLGDKGEYYICSITELPFEDCYFDASISLHTIYHIHKDMQEKAVRELLRVTKGGGRVIVVYSNPYSLSRILTSPMRLFKRLFKKSNEQLIYFYLHPLGWWKRFKDGGSVAIKSWRFLTAQESKALIPDNKFGKFIFKIVSRLEDALPVVMAYFGTYIMVIIDKDERGGC